MMRQRGVVHQERSEQAVPTGANDRLRKPVLTPPRRRTSTSREYYYKFYKLCVLSALLGTISGWSFAFMFYKLYYTQLEELPLNEIRNRVTISPTVTAHAHGFSSWSTVRKSCIREHVARIIGPLPGRILKNDGEMVSGYTGCL